MFSQPRISNFKDDLQIIEEVASGNFGVIHKAKMKAGAVMFDGSDHEESENDWDAVSFL
eukprot:TRINITY_DN941_c0_g1_i1.p2 TRINITY_DN941_c0_g1~~TRINITY_DN941_c0_g1_i1.p2  ORF type:complete len:59 (+),score=14.27 TRINITY_DN941_c0_g1_i1:88-264(+)